MSDSKTGGKILEWEEMIRGKVSAVIVSGYAKSMVGVINDDLESIQKMRMAGEFEKSEERIYKCNVSAVTMSPSGDHIAICYSVLMNRISAKHSDELAKMGFITRNA